MFISCLLLLATGACNSEPTSSESDVDADTDSDADADSDSDADAGSACALQMDRVRVTELDVGQTVVVNEDEAALLPLAISPLQAGGSRLAWMGDDGNVHVTTLDADDQIVENAIAIPAHDFGDLFATADGGVLVISRDAEGGGVENCGNPDNLCFRPDNDIPCYNMYMVGFDEAGETWATRLTEATDTLPPYSNAPDGDTVTMIWWYAHHARIASDGDNFAAYYGVAISVAEPDCINIHQGDRMNVVDENGNPISGGFGLGCSHSGYERIVRDDIGNRYLTVCINDLPTDGESGKLAFAPSRNAILPVDLHYANVGDVVPDGNGAFWVTISHRQDGEPISADGVADVHLVRFDDDGVHDDINITADESRNARAPHLAAYGDSGLLVAFETSSAPGNLTPWDDERTLHVQAFDRRNGDPIGDTLNLPDIPGNRYISWRAFPDGSVAFPLPGTTSTAIRILRILPCLQ